MVMSDTAGLPVARGAPADAAAGGGAPKKPGPELFPDAKPQVASEQKSSSGGGTMPGPTSRARGRNQTPGGNYTDVSVAPDPSSPGRSGVVFPEGMVAAGAAERQPTSCAGRFFRAFRDARANLQEDDTGNREARFLATDTMEQIEMQMSPAELQRQRAEDAKMEFAHHKIDKYFDNDNAPLFVTGTRVLHAKSAIKNGFDLFIGLLITYSVMMIPWRIGFDIAPSRPGQVFDVFIDLCFAIDIGVQFNASFFVKDRLISDRTQIAIKYITGWFWVDFISTFPFDRIVGQGVKPDNVRTFKMIRLFRMSKLLKLLRMFRMPRNLALVLDWDPDPHVVGLVGMFFRIIFISHLFCCLFHLVGTNPDTDQTWIDTYMDGSETTSQKYIICIAWTVGTMMSVGYGDMSATNTPERIYSICTECMGACVFGMILVQVTDFAEGDPSQALIRRRMFELKSFMRHRRVSKPLQKRILNFYDNLWMIKSPLNETKIYSQLPESMRRQLALQSYKTVVWSVKLLFESESKFTSEILLAMTPRLFGIQEVLYKSRKEAEGLYMLVKGVVEVHVLHDYEEEVVAICSVGSHFGDERTLSNACPATMANYGFRSATPLDTFLVSHERLESILFLYKEIAKRMSRLITSRYELYEVVRKELPLKTRKSVTVKVHQVSQQHPFSQAEQSNRHGVVDSMKVSFGRKEMTNRQMRHRIIVYNGAMSNLMDVAHIWPVHFVKLDEDDELKIPDTFKCERTLKVVRGPGGRLIRASAVDPKTNPNNNMPGGVIRQNKLLRQKSTFKRVDQVLGVKNLQKILQFEYADETHASLWKRRIIHPENPRKIRWDLYVGGLIIYSVLMIPFQICYDLPSEGFLAGVDWVIDISFAIDICVSFRTAYYDKFERVYVTVPHKMALDYVKSWFIIDFVSTAPISDIVAAVSASNSSGSGDELQRTQLRTLKLVRVMRLIRLAKLARIFKLGTVATLVEELVGSPALTKMCELTFLMFFAAHILGCFWYYIASSDPLENGAWWTQPPVGMIDADRGPKYLASLYWAFTTMTTVGYGDIHPKNTTERCYAIFGMICGTTVFGYVVGKVVTLLSNFNLAWARADARMDAIHAYMRLKKVQPRLRNQVDEFYDHYWEIRSAWDHRQLLEGLPNSMKSELHNELYGPAIRRIPLFADKSPGFVSQVAHRMRPRLYTKIDKIFLEGQMGKEMFFVITGQVWLLRKLTRDLAGKLRSASPAPLHKRPSTANQSGEALPPKRFDLVATLTHGASFGEYSMLFGQPRPVSAVSADLCYLMTLRKKDLSLLVDEYPSWIELLADMLAESLELRFVREKIPSLADAVEHKTAGDEDNDEGFAQPGVMRNLLHELLVRFSSNNLKVINHFHAAEQDGSEEAVQAAVVRGVLTRDNHSLLKQSTATHGIPSPEEELPDEASHLHAGDAAVAV